MVLGNTRVKMGLCSGAPSTSNGTAKYIHKLPNPRLQIELSHTIIDSHQYYQSLNQQYDETSYNDAD